ncbi:MAG: TlpA family protein disulfide reductase [Bacteriovoracaceae bacterium]|nr:TlpA family protein disulfide reductase [Bacteriovoracaceae bacterium]
MKKYLPILLFILVFSGYLFFQVAAEQNEVEAGLASTGNHTKLHLESLFEDTQLITIEGKELDLPSLTTPIVILSFWASWCTNCMVELPTLVEFQKSLDPGQISVISINADNSDVENKISSVMKKLKINFPVVSDVDGDISQDFKVTGLPTTLVFKKGKLIEIHNGVTDFTAEEFKSKLR